MSHRRPRRPWRGRLCVWCLPRRRLRWSVGRLRADAMKSDVAPPPKPISYAELVAVTGAVMALNALAIDMMLPSLGLIGAALGVTAENDRQLVVVVYIIANGVSQLFMGPVVDRFGRRKVLLWALGAYAVGSLLSVIAQNFTLLIAARIFQGAATAGARVAVLAMVRDRYSGAELARVMSVAITIFMAAPVFAPLIGQSILSVGSWRWIFFVLFACGAVMALWAAIRMRETQSAADRPRLSFGRAFTAYREFFGIRLCLGYVAVQTLLFGGLFGFISSSEQIFIDQYGLGALFPAAFGASAIGFAIAAIVNSRIVVKAGMRRLARGGLIALIAVQIVHLSLHGWIADSPVLFTAFMTATLLCMGFVTPNAQALAMEPAGHIAGVAAAANGFATGALGGAIGGLIGRLYNGTTIPLIAGFALLGALALLAALWADGAPAGAAERHGSVVP
ncbi:MAG: multidrug effflux MFS transporter [Parvularculaceae bacterium]|nr:multidrug effflux MFS transporter [Parvularculaceae bacterium]